MMFSKTRRAWLIGAFAALAVSLIGATAETEGHPCCANSNKWLHQHRLQYKTQLNDLDNNTFRTQAEQARKEWRDDTILAFKLVTNHDAARIHGRDNNYGNTGWIGLAETCFHCNHRDFFLDSFYQQGDEGWQGTTCQEMGHIIGLDHMAGDCMGKGYFSDSSNHVSSTSIQHIKNYYDNPPDDSPTHIRAGTSSDKESDTWDLLGG